MQGIVDSSCWLVQHCKRFLVGRNSSPSLLSSFGKGDRFLVLLLLLIGIVVENHPCLATVVVAEQPSWSTTTTSRLSSTTSQSPNQGGARTTTPPAAMVPTTVSWHELQQSSSHNDNPAFWRKLSTALQTTGLVAVQLEDEFPDRSAALKGLCQCRPQLEEQYSSSSSSTQSNSIQSVALMDGSTLRTTVATATAGSASPLPLTQDLESPCGTETVHAMEAVRDQVSEVTTAFVQALDQLLLRQTNNNDGSNSHQGDQLPLLRNLQDGTYHTVSSIQEAALHLEHFHIYSKQEEEQQQQQEERQQEQASALDSPKAPARMDPSSHEDNAATPPDGPSSVRDTTTTTRSSFSSPQTLPWHTDAGLFLSFVPARNCGDDHHDNNDDEDDSFWLWDDTHGGAARPVRFPPHSVIVMMGAGAQDWLQHTNMALHATRHAVHLQPGQVRAWYGMSKYRVMVYRPTGSWQPRRWFLEIGFSQNPLGLLFLLMYSDHGARQCHCATQSRSNLGRLETTHGRLFPPPRPTTKRYPTARSGLDWM